jgi:hypothetical protein
MLSPADVENVLSIAAADDDVEVLVLVPHSSTAAPWHGDEQRGRLPAEQQVPKPNQEAQQVNEGVDALQGESLAASSSEDKAQSSLLPDALPASQQALQYAAASSATASTMPMLMESPDNSECNYAVSDSEMEESDDESVFDLLQRTLVGAGEERDDDAGLGETPDLPADSLAAEAKAPEVQVAPSKKRQLQDNPARPTVDAEHERREALFRAAEEAEAEKLQDSYNHYFTLMAHGSYDDAGDGRKGIRMSAECSSHAAYNCISSCHCVCCVGR